MKKFLSLLALLCITTAFSSEVHTLEVKNKVPEKQISDIPSLLYTGLGGILLGAGIMMYFSKED